MLFLILINIISFLIILATNLLLPNFLKKNYVILLFYAFKQHGIKLNGVFFILSTLGLRFKFSCTIFYYIQCCSP